MRRTGVDSKDLSSPDISNVRNITRVFLFGEGLHFLSAFSDK